MTYMRVGNPKPNYCFKERQTKVAAKLLKSLSYAQKKALASLLVDELTTSVIRTASDTELSRIQDNILKVYETLEDHQRGIMFLDDLNIPNGSALSFDDMLSEIEMLHELFCDKCNFWYDNPQFESKF